MTRFSVQVSMMALTAALLSACATVPETPPPLTAEQQAEIQRQSELMRARREAEDFARVQTENSLAAHRAYLDAHPTGPNAASVRQGFAVLQARDQAAWDAARRTDSRAAYEAYLERDSGGAFETQARARIREIRIATAPQVERTAIQEAQLRGTVAAYDLFLRTYPQSVFAEDASAAREALVAQEREAFNQYLRADSVRAMEEYLARYPNGLYLSLIHISQGIVR